MNFKEEIAQKIYNSLEVQDLKIEDIVGMVEVPKEKNNGDFAFPCFRLAKILRKSPVDIANDLSSKIHDEIFEKIEAINGFLNFYISKDLVAKNTIEKFEKQDKEL